MSDAYTKQLRADSVETVTTLICGLLVFLFLVGFASTISYELSWKPFLFLLLAGASLRTTQIAHRWAKADFPSRAGTLFVAVHLLVITIVPILITPPNQPGTFPNLIFFFYAVFIVLSNMIIHPRAGIATWIASTTCMVAVLPFLNALSWENLFKVTGISFILLIIAAADYFSAIDWEIALETVNAVSMKAQRRRDELYATQEQLRRANNHLELLNTQLETSVELNKRLTSILDFDQLLAEVAALIKAQFGYSTVSIFLIGDSPTTLWLQGQAGGDGTTHLSSEPCLIEQNDTSLSQAVISHQQIRVDDLSAMPYNRHPFLLPETRSELVLPLRKGENLFGVLDIQSRKLEVFDTDSTRVLQSLADQLAIAIQNAQLYAQEENRRHFAEKMNEIGRSLSGTLNLEEELQLIMELMASIVPHERTAVLLQRQRRLEFVATRNFPEEFDPSKSFIPMTENDPNDIFQKIYRSQEPLVIADVAQVPAWQHVGTPQRRAWLGLPLIRGDEVVGMLSLARSATQPFSTAEIGLATAFATQAAIALQNARLYNRVARSSQQLEYEVQQRTQALSEAYDKLERLDRTKSDFIQVVSHELRTPLTVLRGYSAMLLQDKVIAGTLYHAQLVEGIQSGAVRLHEIVNTLLDVVKIDSRALELYPEPVFVVVLITNVVQGLKESLTERRQTVTMGGLNELPALIADPDALSKVFYHLVVNAIKFTPDGGKIQVTGQFVPAQSSPLAQDSLEIIVSDTGIGIDPAFHDLIFTKFYQTGKVALHSSGKTKFKGGGPGLGLTIAKGIVEAHQGQLWVESPGYDEETFPGSHFHLLLPLRQL